jgi:hypothetical protein
VKSKRIVDRALLEAVRKQPCTVGLNCYGPVAAHHVTTRGAGGGDTQDNVMPLCVRHHQMIHLAGYKSSWEENPGILAWLTLNGRDDIIQRALSRDTR